MKLLRLTLEGEYKGLTSQTFNFSHSQGNVIAFIGLNGSGKSQLLELIAEVFTYLEREQRVHSFLEISKPLGFNIILEYQITKNKKFFEYKIQLGFSEGIRSFTRRKSKQYIEVNHISKIILPHVVGYASGLHENLQRPFMKNAVQFYQIIKIRQDRTKKILFELSKKEVNVELINKINEYYYSKYPHIFDFSTIPLESIGISTLPRGSILEEMERNQASLGIAFGYDEADTPIPNMIFMDYDCNSLLMASLSLLEDNELNKLFPEINYRLPRFIKLYYNLRKNIVAEDTIKDIQLLYRIGGKDCITGIGTKTTDEQYNYYELDYLEGIITFDLTDSAVKERLQETHYNTPLVFFKRLYKLQLIGIKNWSSKDRKNLTKDNFFGTVKKPVKGKLPLSIEKLELTDTDDNTIDFDDLSDGEAQLIEILAAIKLFKDEETLFLFDEPETHLNPAWRTNFHKHIENALGENNNNQIFLSTHSPFMISSLKASNVFYFERDNNRKIHIIPVEHETYGASFDVLIKQFFDLRSLISQTAVQEIKQHLKGNSKDAREWIDKNLGDSMEKAYLLRKLQE